jgi:hypothetical protein
LPSRLTDAEFWRLSEDLSEPNGFFRSDNLVSNELVFARVLPDLKSKVAIGGVYLGVGPEQNFTYIAAIRPRVAFIIDIRRGNLLLQLMYKALFELSADRAEFVSRLFTKPRQTKLSDASTAADLMNAYWDVPSSDGAAYAANLKAIDDLLVQKHHLTLSDTDLAGIEAVYHAFYWFGPSITWSASVNATGVTMNGRGTFADLMMQTDPNGLGLSFLATEESFKFLKDLESRNLVVPVVGDFGGPKALRAVGAYLKDHHALVSAFYLSNVEGYLRQDNKLNSFCANVASMPLDETSVYIRPSATVAMRTFVTTTSSGGIATTTPTVTVVNGQVIPMTPVTTSGSVMSGSATTSGPMPIIMGTPGITTPSILAEVKGCSGGAPASR